jgi:hypothetical protein
MTYTKAAITSRSIDSSRASWPFDAWRQDGLHSPIRMFDRLCPVWVCDDLGLAVRMLVIVVAGRVSPNRRRFCWHLPLRYSAVPIHEVELLLIGIPLRNPALGDLGRRIARAIVAR